MAETATAEAPHVETPLAGRQVSEAYEQSDIRNTPEFKETFKAFRAKARPSGSETFKNAPAPPKPPEAAKAQSAAKPEPKDKTATPVPEPELGEENEEAAPAETTAEEAETTEAPAPETEAKAEPGKGKKLSPWRMVDQWKEKATRLEKELLEAKSKSIPEADSKVLTERLTKAETRVKELEDEIRYVDYQKSPEFLEKYHRPYENAFKRAVAELSEVPVTDAAGNQRPATAQDMLTLLSLPLAHAREKAKEMFGEFADDAMTHRKELKGLFETRQAAIEEAKTTGAEREKQKREQMTRTTEEAGKAVKEIWEKANNEAVTDPKYGQYFTPRENDPEWNQRLAKGTEFVDKAFSDPNPRDPRLAPADREKIIRRHAAVKHRAAAFGAVRYENERLQAKVSALEKQLAEYKESEPGSTGTAKSNAGKQESTGYGWGDVSKGLRKYAKPI